MLGESKAFGSFPVDDLARARSFYGEMLGLTVSEQPGPLWLQIAGDQTVLLYPKPDHTPASFTVLNFPVDDIGEAVEGLSARGVQTERFEDFEVDERGIYRSEGHSIAWFKDPAGNILSVFEED